MFHFYTPWKHQKTGGTLKYVAGLLFSFTIFNHFIVIDTVNVVPGDPEVWL